MQTLIFVLHHHSGRNTMKLLLEVTQSAPKMLQSTANDWITSARNVKSGWRIWSCWQNDSQELNESAWQTTKTCLQRFHWYFTRLWVENSLKLNVCFNMWCQVVSSTRLGFTLFHRWLQWHSAPLEKGQGSDGRSFPQSHPTGSALDSRPIRSATGTFAGSGSPPGSAAGHIGQTYADGHIQGRSSNWFWWFLSSQRPGTKEGEGVQLISKAIKEQRYQAGKHLCSGSHKSTWQELPVKLHTSVLAADSVLIV